MIETIRFTDPAGSTLWEEPKRLSRPLVAGDSIAEKGIVYRVSSVQVEGVVQNVKLLPVRSEARHR